MFASVRFRASAAGSVFGLVVLLGSADYTVQQGDTLAEIAAANGTTAQAIAEVNALTDMDLILIGQVLVIPGAPDGSAVRYHRVASGDSLAAIASLYGTTASALVSANGISNPNLIMPGQELVIPEPGLDVTSPGGPDRVHLVATGETLGSIASTYGTTVEALMAANGITNPSLIFAGIELRIDGEPRVAPVATPVQSAAAHVVAVGETLSAIAVANGTTAADLATANGLADPNLIVVGQTLNVPATGWLCPVPGATYFNDWGFPRSGGRFHTGNDLFAPRGNPVMAPVSGTVEQIIGQLGGAQFRLHGDDGNVYVGSHLDGFGFGGYVIAGTVIGYVGDSGNAKGSNPHLHFEIITNGTEVNPYPTLQQYGC